MALKQDDEKMIASADGSGRLKTSGIARTQPNRALNESKLSPGLYLVATPIGNIRDVTLRALDVLATVDIVACEDTRVTGKLLRIYGITAAQTFPYHEHNAEKVRPKLLARLSDGASVALVSDAGTPLISDPGYKLVREAADAGVAVHVVPGPSAGISALVAAGLPTDRFLFAGFPPPRQAARIRMFGELAAIPASLVFFESTRRLAASLADMAKVLGPREAVVARELTKLHEELRRGDLESLARHYGQAGPPKGEAVVVVGPPPAQPVAGDLDGMLVRALADMSVKDAAAMVSVASGRPRREVYSRALELTAARRRGGGRG